MKLQLQLHFIFLIILLIFGACASHGPAYSGQENSLMVKPWLEEGEFKNQQFYLTGKVGIPYTYLAGEQNKLAGESMIHFSTSFRNFQSSYGVFGYFGGYRDTLQNNLPYFGIGIRSENNWVYRLDENLEFYPIGFGATIAREFGSYTYNIERRDTGTSKRINDHTVPPMSFYITTGLRYKTPKSGIWQFQYARSIHWSSIPGILQFNGSDDLTFSGQFKNIILHSRISFNRSENEIISTKAHWYAGITWAF